MQIPSVPPITGFSEWMDLLGNVPAYQERLTAMKEMTDLINARLGDLEEVQAIKRQKNEAQVCLEDAKDIKREAMEEARKIRAEADFYRQKTMAALVETQEEIKAKRIEAEAIQAGAEKLAGQLGQKEAELQNWERELINRMTALNAREAKARELVDDFERRKADTLRIWG